MTYQFGGGDFTAVTQIETALSASEELQHSTLACLQ